MNLQDKTIAIIGLGYVGLPLAVEFGKNRNTLGFDINQTRIAELKSGQDHTLECTPEDLQSATYLRYSANMVDLQTAQIFIVTVPTPVDQANRPDMTPLVKASETVGKVLKAGDIVIYESTVYPGATEEVCVTVLWQARLASMRITSVTPMSSLSAWPRVGRVTGSSRRSWPRVCLVTKGLVLRCIWKKRLTAQAGGQRFACQWPGHWVRRRSCFWCTRL